MASKIYASGMRDIVDGTISLSSDTIKVALVDASYTYAATHDFMNDVSANELSGTGYTGGFGGSGRKTLASKTITVNSTHIEFDAADITWTGLNAGTIGGAILIEEITNDASSALLAFIDPTDLPTNGGDVTLVVNSGGFMQIANA